MTSLSELRFFSTPSHDCSYLPDKQAITLFVDPRADIDTEAYTTLSANGFRRSGEHIYRPHCADCQACIPVRVDTQQFKLNRRQKRNMKLNQDLEVRAQTPYFAEPYYHLYAKYIRARHADGDMYPPSQEQFRSFLVDGRQEAIFFEMTLDRKLLAVAVADRLQDGMSAIYTFFDPDASDRGLGNYAVLWLIEEAKRRGLPFVYLGYWIKDCQKMSYKMDYQPQQRFVNNQWIEVIKKP